MQASMRLVVSFLLLASVWPVPEPAAAAMRCPAPNARVGTIIGLTFCIDPAFETAMAAQVVKIRADVGARRQAGKLVAYALSPIDSGNGANERVDAEIAASVKARLERELGDLVWVLSPADYRMPARGARPASPEEQMLVWTRVLAGEDGLGRDVDLAYFSGPRDTRAYFGCGAVDLTGCVARWIATRAAADEVFQREVAGESGRREAFLRHYVLRASTTYSKAAHDQWNALVRVNRRRQLGDQIGIFFDGRPVSPPEMETQVSPGYELR
jgi:hypothetical protein